MNKYNQSSTLKSLALATAAIGLVAIPFAQAENERTKMKSDPMDKTTNTDPSKMSRTTSTKVHRIPLKADVTATFVDGYTVPDQYRTHFTDLPAIEGKNVVVRYHNGRAYYVDSNDWKIVRIVDLDPSIKVDEESSAFVEGYVIPETTRTRFIEVPNPDAKLSVRYYNNTAYYMDSDFRIVRTVRLTR